MNILERALGPVYGINHAMVCAQKGIDIPLFRSILLACKAIRDWASIDRRINNPSLATGTRNSSSRDKWVQKVLAELPLGARLLDAGAGEQKYRTFCAHLNYFSQDNIAYDGLGDGRGGHVEGWTYGFTDYVCDIVNIPADQDSFDAVLCTEVFEHLPDPLAALAELTRLLRPGGVLFLTAPFCSFTHFSPYFYSTGFSRNWYLYHLRRLGFTHIELTPNGNFFEYLAQEVRRIPAMSSKYSSRVEPWRVRLSMLTLLEFLDQCSSDDTGSSEYACYGWHVKAVKGICAGVHDGD